MLRHTESQDLAKSALLSADVHLFIQITNECVYTMKGRGYVKNKI